MFKQRSSSITLFLFFFSISLFTQNHQGQKHLIVIRSDTSFFLFHFLYFSLHLFSFSFPLSNTLPAHFPLPLFSSLMLTLSDSVSMLSRTNPPLRGVKALPHLATQTHTRPPPPPHTQAQRRSRSRKVSICRPARSNGIFYT